MQSEPLSYLFAVMATKEDIRALRSEMRGEVHVMKAELQAAIAASSEQNMQAIVDF